MYAYVDDLHREHHAQLSHVLCKPDSGLGEPKAQQTVVLANSTKSKHGTKLGRTLCSSIVERCPAATK